MFQGEIGVFLQKWGCKHAVVKSVFLPKTHMFFSFFNFFVNFFEIFRTRFRRTVALGFSAKNVKNND